MVNGVVEDVGVGGRGVGDGAGVVSLAGIWGGGMDVVGVGMDVVGVGMEVVGMEVETTGVILGAGVAWQAVKMMKQNNKMFNCCL